MTTLGTLVRAGVLQFGDGYRTRQDELAGLGYRILRAGDVRGGRVWPDGPDFVALSYGPAIGDKAAREGDVVLTTKGTVGRVGTVRALDQKVAYSPQVCFFRCSDTGVLTCSYLHYWLMSPAFTSQCSYLMGATDMAPYISLRDLAAVQIELPCADTQRAIAEVLGALDDKIAANESVAFQAESLAQMRFDQSMSTFETRVPLSCKVQAALGGTPSRGVSEYWNGGVPWASAKDVTNAPNGVVLATEEMITDRAAQATRVKPIPEGSVVLTARGTVGAVARLGVPSAFNQSCYAFVPGLYPAAVLYFVIREAAVQCRSLAHGSVFDTITLKTFDHIMTPDFSVADLARMEEDLLPLLARVTASVTESRHLAALRDTLLPHLMSGRLTVRQAEQAVSTVL